MVKNKKLLVISLILYTIVIVMNIRFPHEKPFGETVASIFNIPAQPASGFQYIGILSVILIVTSFYLLAKSLRKHRVLILFLVFIITGYLLSFITTTIQKTFATDIYAVSYDRDFSNCKLNKTNEGVLHGICELSFINYSKDDIQFTVEFYDKHVFEAGVRMTLLNNNGPYEVRLMGKERKKIKIETDIDVSSMENHVYNAQVSAVNIVMKSGDRIRRL